jgi:hypothetical protein
MTTLAPFADTSVLTIVGAGTNTLPPCEGVNVNVKTSGVGLVLLNAVFPFAVNIIVAVPVTVDSRPSFCRKTVAALERELL